MATKNTDTAKVEAAVKPEKKATEPKQAAEPKKAAQPKKAAEPKKAAKPAAAQPKIFANHVVVESKEPLYKYKPAKGTVPYETKGRLRVELVKSTIGALKGQKATVQALGLKKIRSSRIHNDNPAIRGMIYKVRHLVKVEEVK